MLVRPAVQEVKCFCSFGTFQQHFVLTFTITHNEHYAVAWGKHNLVFHLSWAVNALFLLFHFGFIFLWCNSVALKCNTLKHILNPRAGPSLPPHHTLMNLCEQLESTPTDARSFLFIRSENLASHCRSWLLKSWAAYVIRLQLNTMIEVINLLDWPRKNVYATFGDLDWSF